MIYSLQWVMTRSRWVLVLPDLSAAFHIIDHEILLYCLHNVFGFGDTVYLGFNHIQRIEHKLLFFMENTQLQLLFIMMYHRDQFLDQYFLFFTHSLYQMSFSIIQFFIKFMQMTHRSTNRADHLKLQTQSIAQNSAFQMQRHGCSTTNYK